MRFQPARSCRKGPPTPIVTGLPLGGDHPMHPFAIDRDGSMYIDVATATNACQQQNRTPKSPGINPCTELETRGGIWRYDANKTNQAFSPAERFATGIRNAEGFGDRCRRITSSSPNTDATSYTRIGRSCTNPRRRPRSRPKSCCA